MKKSAILLFIFLFFSVHAKVFSAGTRLPLKSFYTNDDSLEAKDISEEDFDEDSNVDGYEKDGFCWIETEIPVELLKKHVDVLKFSDELFNSCEVFIQRENGDWEFLGKTGIDEERRDENDDYHLNAVSFSPSMEYPDGKSPLKVRAKIFCDHSTYVSVYAMDMRTFTELEKIRSIHLSVFIGIVIMTIFFIAFTCRSFKDYSYIYLTVVCFVLALYVLFVNGVLENHFGKFFKLYNIGNSFVYFLLTGASLCSCWSLIERNKNFIRNFPSFYVRLHEIFPFFTAILMIVGVLIAFIPLSNDFIGGFRFFGIAAPLVFYIIQMKAAFRYNPTVRKSTCSLWIISCSVLILQQLFKILRFKEGSPFIFGLFNEDKGIPEAFAMLIIGIATFERLHERIRMRLAALQIKMEDVRRKVDVENKHNFVYSKISSMLLNTLQVFSASVENVQSNEIEKLKLVIRSNADNSMQLVKALSVLSESGRENYGSYYSPGPVYLHSLVTDVLEPEYSVLKMNNCFVDVHEYYSEEICLYADKDLLSLVLRFMLQTVHNAVIPKTQVLVSAEYKEDIFSLSVKFSSESLTGEQAKNILGLGRAGEENLWEDELLGKWGMELYVANLIAEFLGGSISIVPDVQGCVIVLKIALDPAVTYVEDNIHESSVFNLSNGKKEIPLSNDIVYILEEDRSVRGILEHAFAPYFKTVILGNGTEFLAQAKAWPPDFVICSMDLPGKNAVQLLDEESMKSVPFFVVTKFATKKMVEELYSKGAIDVFQKPFNVESMVRKAVSTLRLKKAQSKALLERLHESFTDEVFNKTVTFDEDFEEGLSSRISAEENPLAKKDDSLKNLETVSDISIAPEESLVQALCISAGLTNKETSIAILISKNKTDKEIAAELGISPSTVAVHNKKIFKKLGIHSRNELLEKIK